VHLDLNQSQDLSIAQQQMGRSLPFRSRTHPDHGQAHLSAHLSEVDLFRIVRRLRDDGTAIVFISAAWKAVRAGVRVTVLRDGNTWTALHGHRATGPDDGRADGGRSL
jgi:ABC-type sugar transport system ATPase subunit